MSAIAQVKIALATGTLTYHAVSELLRSFQAAAGLPPSGEADPETVRVLEAMALARASAPATPVVETAIPEPAYGYDSDGPVNTGERDSMAASNEDVIDEARKMPAEHVPAHKRGPTPRR